LTIELLVNDPEQGRVAVIERSVEITFTMRT